jgi:hypothetical protein
MTYCAHEVSWCVKILPFKLAPGGPGRAVFFAVGLPVGVEEFFKGISAGRWAETLAKWLFFHRETRGFRGNLGDIRYGDIF